LTINKLELLSSALEHHEQQKSKLEQLQEVLLLKTRRPVDPVFRPCVLEDSFSIAPCNLYNYLQTLIE